MPDGNATMQSTRLGGLNWHLTGKMATIYMSADSRINDRTLSSPGEAEIFCRGTKAEA